jgi:cytochrome c oxidase subunit III
MSQTTTAVDAGHPPEHEPFLQHHFAEMQQQADASKIGMWLFLATEILLFGGLFVGYGIMNSLHREAFVAAHHHLNRMMGATNTIVLLCSSWTMVMAVHSASKNRRKATIGFLIVTLLCAAAFMVIKYLEYSEKFHLGLLPGHFYHGPLEPKGQFMFFSFYFMMTGLHGIHVLAGMIAITWILRRTIRGDFSSRYYTPVDLVGLYWHLVDMIWIYLFPLMYLIS